jgi:hypothetical protein
MISHQGVRVSSKALHDKTDTLNASETCGQGDYRTSTVQRRPVARSQWVATIQGVSTTLGSRAATVPSDLTPGAALRM